MLMSALSEINPKDRQLIIDLVRAAGVSVSDWGNFKGGEKNAARNPKYCYEWSFVEARKLVVLNLWYASMQERDGVIVQDLNLREIAHRFGEIPNKAVWARRSLNMDLAIQTAFRERLPIRVVVCEGKMRDIDDPGGKPSQVNKRLLDPVPWAVTAYDWNTGKCTVTRGAPAGRFVDQFSIPQESLSQVERRPVSGQAFVRNPEIRRRVLLRAKGKCEWCAQPGFTMADGKIFLETHHVIPLAEGGPDTGSNVVALCPNHHREAHHGANSPGMRKLLLDRLVHVNAELSVATDPGVPWVEP
ncbi:MAG: HNH endonuclease [Nitrospirota bacterium]